MKTKERRDFRIIDDRTGCECFRARTFDATMEKIRALKREHPSHYYSIESKSKAQDDWHPWY